MVHSDVPAQSASHRESQSDADSAARFVRESLPLLDPLYRGALWLTGDHMEAEDLLVETMMNAYSQFGSLPASANLRALLYRALTKGYIRGCHTRCHRMMAYPTDATIGRQPPATAARSSTGLSLAQVEALEALPTAVITNALRALEPDIRMAVYYADVEGLSYREIGDITNRSVKAVASVVRRGRLQLRNLLLAASREPAASQFRTDAPKGTAHSERATSKQAPLHRLSESDTRAGQLDWFDREILRYVLLWATYGEMWDEDAYPKFGMTVEQLVDRFHLIIAKSLPRISRLGNADRELLDKARHLPQIFGQAR
jgi:RNA polymerase sigma-70 factor (ECF subfamily)